MLDSASEGYKLPFDTLRSITFDSQGRKILDIGYTSDVVYIQNTTKIYYRQDTVITIRTDSSLSSDELMQGVFKSKYEEIYENKQLVQRAYYPSRLKGKAEWTKVF
ncbi:MAG: hypothetical protein AAFP82_16040, partial [Bacteroidota bacterium]